MKISTKFNLIVGFFFVFVFVAVFYSYCGGLHVCYSFPFFNSFGPRGGRTRVTMTSYILESKPDMSRDQEEDILKNTNSAIKTLYFQNEHKQHKHSTAKDSGSPSYVTGEVAKEILRKANVSEEQANRELYREEKVDKTVDKENRSALGHQKLAFAKKNRKEPGARGHSFDVHPIRKPPRRAKSPIRSKKMRMRKAEKWKETYKDLLTELEQHENLTQKTVDSRTKSSKRDKHPNSEEAKLKSQDQNSTYSITVKTSKMQKQKSSKDNKTVINDAVDITGLQQTSKQAIAEDLDKLNKENGIRSKVFESRFHIMKISNATVMNRIRNSTKATLLDTRNPNARIISDETMLTNTKNGENFPSFKEKKNDKLRTGLDDKKMSESQLRKQNNKSAIGKKKAWAEKSLQESKDKESLQVPLIITPKNITNNSSKPKQNDSQQNVNYYESFDESSLSYKVDNNEAKHDITRNNSKRPDSGEENILDRRQYIERQETTTKDKSLAIGERKGVAKPMKAIKSKEIIKTVRRGGKSKYNGTFSLEGKISLTKHREVLSTKKSKDNSTFTKGTINHKNISINNTTRNIRNNIKSLPRYHSYTSKQNPTAETNRADDGSGEEPKTKSISLRELTRSVRNIKYRNTIKALAKVLEKDEQKIKKLASKIKAVRERRSQPFSLSKVLRDLVTKPDFFLEEFDDEDNIFKRSAPESNKALFRIKRVKLGVPDLKMKSSHQEPSLKRVKRIEGDSPQELRVETEKALIRVKRKELEENYIADRVHAKNYGVDQRKPASGNNKYLLQADGSKAEAKNNNQDITVKQMQTKNDVSLHDLEKDTGHTTTKTSKSYLPNRKHHNRVLDLSGEAVQTFPKQLTNQNKSKSNIAALNTSASQTSATVRNHKHIDPKKDLKSKKIIPKLNSKQLAVYNSRNTIDSTENEEKIVQEQKQTETFDEKKSVGTTRNVNTAKNLTRKSRDFKQTILQAKPESDKELLRVKRG